MSLLALDQGTTSSRLVRYENATLMMVGQLRHTTTYPAPGHVEQDANELLRNCETLLEAAGSADALGLANQGESCLAWDAESGLPLSPILVWQDSRTEAALADLRQSGIGPEVAARSGLPLDPYFSAAKLGWLLSLPSVANAHARGRLRLGTTDAFFLDRLTSRFVTDRTTASRSGLMNLALGEWDPWLCDLFGVPIDCLPEIVPTIGDFGQARGIPLVASIVDQQAALYGHGCEGRGQTKMTFGTGAFLLANLGRSLPDVATLKGLVPTVAWDLGDGAVFAVEGGVPDAASAVDWAIRAGLARDVGDFQGFTAAPAIDRGLVFLPCFSGIGAPHWDRTAAPTMIGLNASMGVKDIRQALLEGVAYLSATLIRTVADLVQIDGPIAVDGGLSANRYFLDMTSRLSGHRLAVSGMQECTALGCIKLAALATGKDLGLAQITRTIVEGAPAPEAWRAQFDSVMARTRGWVC
ncbi:MAG: FGGY family carbohydrate kinase [Paracoccaceae bacterium]